MKAGDKLYSERNLVRLSNSSKLSLFARTTTPRVYSQPVLTSIHCFSESK